MRYFEGLAFRFHAEVPGCTAWCRKRFDYYVLNYAHSGRIGFSLDGARQRILEAPVAWWTWPGPLFSFGALRGESWHHHFVAFQGRRASRMLREGLLAPRPEPWVHWIIYKIPPEATGLPENVAKTDKPAAPAGGLQGKNSWGKIGYGGPAPPPGHGVHHYHFMLYALDAVLDVQPGLDKRQLLAAMKGHILAQGEVVGRYQR